MVGIPLSEEEIRELLIKEKTCWLATITPKGKPHLIPIHFGFFDGKVYIIFVDGESKSLRNIEHSPSVCFGINIGYKANAIKCVLIHGKAQLIDNIDVMKKAHQKILTKYLPSKEEAKAFLQKLIVSGAIAKRTLVVIESEKVVSWKL
jgi:nitroimidazol reductase NimA-like FMN-containing flavoprotein (pyridoxamine 5'-phosphate oxidase superfamily)